MADIKFDYFSSFNNTDVTINETSTATSSDEHDHDFVFSEEEAEAVVDANTNITNGNLISIVLIFQIQMMVKLLLKNLFEMQEIDTLIQNEIDNIVDGNVVLPITELVGWELEDYRNVDQDRDVDPNAQSDNNRTPVNPIPPSDSSHVRVPLPDVPDVFPELEDDDGLAVGMSIPNSINPDSYIYNFTQGKVEVYSLQFTHVCPHGNALRLKHEKYDNCCRSGTCQLPTAFFKKPPSGSDVLAVFNDPLWPKYSYLVNKCLSFALNTTKVTTNDSINGHKCIIMNEWASQCTNFCCYSRSYFC